MDNPEVMASPDTKVGGMALPADRATHEPSPTSGLGHSVSVPSARPSESSVREQAVHTLATDCARWDMPDGPSQTCIDGWLKALRRCNLNDNGYELARELDRYHGVSPDFDLVEILDSASSYVWQAKRQAVADWVQANDVQPTLKVGDRIAYREWTGVINGIDEGQAQYHLKTDGENDGRYIGGGGICVPYELAQAMAARSGETTGSTEGNSAVAESHAPTPPPISPQPTPPAEGGK